MTYKEQWEKDHPGEKFRVGYVRCPSSHGYRAKESVNDCKPVSCTQCWYGEIPEVKDPVESLQKVATSAKFAGAAFDNLAESAQKVVDSAKKIECADTLHTHENPFSYLKQHTPGMIKDSGDRTEFATGAVRDMREGKGRCDLMPLEVVAEYIQVSDDEEPTFDPVLWCIREFQKSNDTSHLYHAMTDFNGKCWNNCYTMLLEVAKHFEEGAKKYGENNWQKGIPAHCYIDSAVRHYLKWLRGDKDEPHDRAFVWNLMCCIWEVDYHEEESHEEN